MSVPIIYLVTVPDLAQTGLDGSAALINDDLTALNIAVLATVGGALTFTLTSRGSAFTSGTYLNVPIVPITGVGVGGVVNVGVSATGQITVVSANIPGFGFKIGDTFNLLTGAFSTASSVLATMTVLTVLPCSAPFPIGTKYVELSCDANGPAFITFDTTITSVGITNSILTTQQSTLTTVASRIAANQTMLRRVTAALPLIAGVPPAEGFGAPISLQVIMGTAAA